MRDRDVDHSSAVAVIFVDVINHFEFPDGQRLLKNALQVAPNLVRFKARARRAGVPVIYVNDNFGRWRSDVKSLLEYCTRIEAPGREFVQAIEPDEEDYFVLKPMHSAFYQTPLDTLLRYFGASSIILAGLATNSCVICSAHDAKMRDLQTTVVSDCCAARGLREHTQTLQHMKSMAVAEVVQSSSIRFPKR
ncbi:MAG TPA: isochorismatase family cysteine hydrolase [Bryobacteraceae bacterium]|nr:isochorismatase family cysteine hydrolase [Bryobacteraceae bacterium]